MKILNTNRIQYHNQLSGSAVLANLTPTHKQFFKIKSEFKSRDHVSYSYIIKSYSIRRSLSYVLLFKTASLSTKQKFGLFYHLNDEERLFSRGIYIYMIQFFQYRLVFLKYNKAFEILSKVVLHH